MFMFANHEATFDANIEDELSIVSGGRVSILDDFDVTEEVLDHVVAVWVEYKFLNACLESFNNGWDL